MLLPKSSNPGRHGYVPLHDDDSIGWTQLHNQYTKKYIKVNNFLTNNHNLEGGLLRKAGGEDLENFHSVRWRHPMNRSTAKLTLGSICR